MSPLRVILRRGLLTHNPLSKPHKTIGVYIVYPDQSLSSIQPRTGLCSACASSAPACLYA